MRVFDAQKAVNQNNFAFFMEPGLSIFLGDYQGIRTFSFSALAGYRYKNVISVGLSAGVDVGTSRSVIVPAGIGIRGNFLPKKSATPFFDFNAGYTYNNFISAASGSLYYNTVEEKPHGVFYSPALGVKYWFSSTAAITLKAGYYGIMIPGDFNVAIHAFQLKLGMEF